MNPPDTKPINKIEEREPTLPQKQVEFFNPWDDRFKGDLKSDERSFEF